VDVAPDGRTALERMRLYPYDLLIVDLKMPGIDGLQEVAAGEKEPAVSPIFAFPIVDSTVGNDVRIRIGLVDPDFFPGLGIEGNDRVVLSENVSKLVRFDRVEEISVLITGWKDPGDLKFADIGSVDPTKCGILRGLRPASVVTPRCMALANGAGVSAQDKAAGQQHHERGSAV